MSQIVMDPVQLELLYSLIDKNNLLRYLPVQSEFFLPRSLYRIKYNFKKFFRDFDWVLDVAVDTFDP
jgi:hypothetical protein